MKQQHLDVTGVSRGGTHAFAEWLRRQGGNEVSLYEQELDVEFRDDDLELLPRPLVVILRDYLNWLSSFLVFGKAGGWERRASLERRVQLWKNCAAMFLLPDAHVTCVRFNDWFLSRSYRARLATSLDLDFTDDAINNVHEEGRGSSFDGMRYAGKAQEMEVMSRWKKLSPEIELDAEALYLNARVFGDIYHES